MWSLSEEVPPYGRHSMFVTALIHRKAEIDALTGTSIATKNLIPIRLQQISLCGSLQCHIHCTCTHTAVTRRHSGVWYFYAPRLLLELPCEAIQRAANESGLFQPLAAARMALIPTCSVLSSWPVRRRVGLTDRKPEQPTLPDRKMIDIGSQKNKHESWFIQQKKRRPSVASSHPSNRLMANCTLPCVALKASRFLSLSEKPSSFIYRS